MEQTVLRLDEFTVDVRRRGLYRGAERVHLTPKPFAVLVYLVQNRGRVVSKDELLDVVWGGQREGNTVEQAVRQIRLSLGDDTDHPRFIQTIPGEGYSFIATAADADTTTIHPVLGVVARESTDSKPQPAVEVSSGKPVPRYAIVSLLAIGFFAMMLVFRPSLPDARLNNPIRITQSTR
jgi:DNA-binding winged helix-turn-helix (wHTH) protein